ncbi:ABC transporter permease [Clostridioides mangenotii]|uniref:ABC transporter permease n=1 Tax=Metaclostridioides mangenotii TaxID=1540 RepID=UPI002149DFBE|nr:ABC transporter permease [Clostridioides mangenotii]MCR1954634.1 ABC transporter permease [Clostridioides mangenotii]
MHNYFKIITAYIKKYISRTLAICASIVLSIALIVGVGTLSKSAKEAHVAKTKYECGDYHVKYKDLNKEQLEIIKKNKDIQQIGLISYYDSNSNIDDILINIQRANEEYIKLGNSKIIDGKLPIKENEIALEEWVLKNLGVEPKIGENVTLDLFFKKQKETFKLVGILEDRTREKSAGIMEGFLALDSNNTSKIDAYIAFDEKSNINTNIKKIAKEANINKDNVRENGMLLDSLGENGETDYKVIVLGLIVGIVSSIVIYGVFNISILQRTSEYGAIRAIGSDSLQIFKLILGELLILLSISTPIGIGLGIMGAKLFSSISGRLFTEGVVEITKLAIPLDILAFSIIVSLITILIISIITFINIRKISPMDAIRKNTSSNKLGKRQFLSLSFLIKLISFEKAIAFKNIFRSKKSFITIVLSMSLGSAIFIVSGFYAHLANIQGKKIAETSNVNTDYKISMIPSSYMNKGLSNDDINEIKNLKGVESVKSIQLLYSIMPLEKSQIAEPLYFKQKNSSNYAKKVLNGLLTEDKETGEVLLKNGVYGYDDSLLKELDKYLLDGEINIAKMKKENIVLIKIPHPIGPNVVDLKIGDKIKVTFKEDFYLGEDGLKMDTKKGKYLTEEFIVGGIVDEVIDTSDYFTGDNSVDVIIPSSKFKSTIGFNNFQIVNIDKKQGADSNKLSEEIFRISNRVQGSTVRDLGQERGDLDLLQKNKLIFIYSIIVILFVISLFNIMNNISYSLLSRTNEFGMIRAIGMTNKEFKKMIKFEGLTYGVIASILAVIFGAVGQVVLFKYLSLQLISPKFIVQWQSYVLVILINILIGFIATYLPSKKIKDLSIVESISTLE